MTPDLFNDLPFNLAGESLNAEHDAQQEANEKRVRALAESEARKAQTEFRMHVPDKSLTEFLKNDPNANFAMYEQDRIAKRKAQEPKRDFTARFNCPDCGWHFSQCDCKP